MANRPPKNLLELHLPAASTPARVAQAAEMFQKALLAANPDLDPDSVTMVVRNRDMKCALRAWNPEARTAIADVGTVAHNALQAIQKKPELQFVARALADYSPKLVGAEFMRGDRKKPIATIDELFSKVMSAAASSPAAQRALLRGDTTVYTPILRVGRQDENRTIAIRILLDGSAYDVALRPEVDPRPFFDAAKSEKVVIVRLDAEWIQNQDGRYRYDLKRTTATGLDTSHEPLPGAALLDELRKAAPSFQVMELGDLDSKG